MNIAKIIQSPSLTDAITDDSYSIEHVTYPANAIHADSSTSTPPSLYSPLEATKIIQSLNLTDAITDDSYSNVRLASSIDTIHADSFGQDRSPALNPDVTQ